MIRLIHSRPTARLPESPSDGYSEPGREASGLDGSAYANPFWSFVAAAAAGSGSTSEALAFGLALGAELGRTYPELAPTMIEAVFQESALPELRPFVDQLICLAKRAERQAREREQAAASSRVHERLAQVATLRPGVA
jgi:hypothetical protein